MSSPAGTSVQSPLNLILPIKPCVAPQELDAVPHLKLRDMIEASDNIADTHGRKLARLAPFISRASSTFTTTTRWDLHDLRRQVIYHPFGVAKSLQSRDGFEVFNPA